MPKATPKKAKPAPEEQRSKNEEIDGAKGGIGSNEPRKEGKPGEQKSKSKPKASAKPAINSKDAPVAKAPETAKVVREVRIKLTDAELRKTGDQLADAHQCLAALALEEKSAKQGFKSRRESLNQEIEEAGEKIREKSELRPIDCIVYFDTPRKGLKTIKRADTLETVAEERMIGPDLERPLL